MKNRETYTALYRLRGGEDRAVYKIVLLRGW